MKKTVLITRNLISDGEDYLKENGFRVISNPHPRAFTYEELKAEAARASALICTLEDKIDEEFLRANSHLKVIANYAVGFNNIDLKTARELGIKIGNTPDVLTEATAETALGLMIAAARNFKDAAASAYLGRWSGWLPTGHLGQSLKGKTLGVIGMGRIGLRLAEMCHYAFSMDVQYTARSEKKTDFKSQKTTLDELLKTSDFISVHLPLNSETRNCLGEREFKLMRPHTVLVNTARGEIIDQDALLSALKDSRIFSAGLDVTTPEPLPMDHPLYALKNVFILPHIGSATFEARSSMALICARNVMAGLSGLDLVAEVK